MTNMNQWIIPESTRLAIKIAMITPTRTVDLAGGAIILAKRDSDEPTIPPAKRFTP